MLGRLKEGRFAGPVYHDLGLRPHYTDRLYVRIIPRQRQRHANADATKPPNVNT